MAMEATNNNSKTPYWPGWTEATTNQRQFGLELQSPFAGYVLDGRKTIETRAYALPPDLLSNHHDDCQEVRIDILESEMGQAGVSSIPNAVALTDDTTKRPLLKRTGWCTFTQSFKYTSREQFEADEEKHMVDPSSGYGWSEERPMYGWVVGSFGVHEGDNDGYTTAERRMRSLFELLPKNEKNTTPTILITGASGMLGRALHRLLLKSSPDYNVVGTGHTRLEVDHYPRYVPSNYSNKDSTSDPNKKVQLHQLNLLDAHATTELLEKHRPDVIVHCAAERFPDAFEKKLEESMKLNVESTQHLARECQRLAIMANAENDDNSNNSRNIAGGPYMIYISTSYVFDGGVTSKEYPPYGPQSKVNPVNTYGRSKLEGERAVRDILNDPKSSSQAEGGGRGIIVRVPMLYGEDCWDLSESPALEMMKVFLLSSQTTAAVGKKVIDHWALRFPTSVEDVARVLQLVIDQLVECKFPAVAPSLSDTYHIASPHGTTKYELMQLQTKLLGVPGSQVEERTAGNSSGPPKHSAPRPQCTQLDCSETWKSLGLSHDGGGGGQTFEFVSLEDGMKRALDGFPDRFV
eukprot:CAMPEP_0201657964 /NCGR_PEP_ID=MMETSP0494-20130426/1023_1 /ASSEMBLY_ACC=CAM_ASM_000839 /TAXON_ID=420259 /ORGANISM="Thalassiosira gravida, Strain GMp14c1" /LENGTH=576 /DNA_ID=CAMNT_0048134889 /DNA_START=8 /DNA_END=1738 /DNA_ORIENTATION=+